MDTESSGSCGLTATSRAPRFASSGKTSCWTSLMRRNPAGVVAPFSLLVPVVGLSMAFLVLDERPALIEIVASAVVIGGVLFGSTKRRVREPDFLAEAETPQPTGVR